ncbi:hypothetical protein [Larkinella ripae]
MTFRTSSVAPAATGAINVKKDKNKNYIVKVNVRNLADPKNLSPAKKTYLVWMESKENSIKKLGQLTPSGKALQADLSTTTVTNPDQIFITAEDNTDIPYPDGPVVLTTK